MTNERLRGHVSAHSLFIDADGRTVWARRYRDLVALLADDAGGLQFMTELKLALIRRTAALICECEALENKLANGEVIDVDLLARLSSHLRRLAETVGVNRVRRDAVPSLAEVVAKHASKPADHPSRLHARVAAQVARDAKKDAGKPADGVRPFAATPFAALTSEEAISAFDSLAAAPAAPASPSEPIEEPVS